MRALLHNLSVIHKRTSTQGAPSISKPPFKIPIQTAKQDYRLVSTVVSLRMTPEQRSPKRRKLEAIHHVLSHNEKVPAAATPQRKLSEMIVELDHVERRLKNLLLDVAKFIESSSSSISAPAKGTEQEKLELRFTGGWVRDKLLGVGSHDIDVSINKMTGYQFGLKMKEYLDDPSNVAKHVMMKDSKAADSEGATSVGNLHKIAANPEKSKHLETVAVRIFDLDVDFVNLRKESYTEESRNPQMEFGTAEEDALRRDATVNAMFYNLSSSQVEDFTAHGFDDLIEQIIRTPLDPYQTFKDDPLRVLRLIRFATRLGFSIDPAAERAMADTVIKQALTQKITRERIGTELEKMLKGMSYIALLSK